MIIPSDLRIAIIKAQNGQKHIGWDEKRNQRKAAVRDLIAKRKLGPNIKKALALRKKLSKDIERIDKWFASYGLSECGTDIRSGEKFKQAGGVQPIYREHWKASEVLAELIEAKPEDLHKILKKYGINWE